MNLTGLLPLVQKLPAFAGLSPWQQDHPQAVVQAARPFIAAALWNQSRSPVILITARSEMAQQLSSQLENWLPPADDGGPPILIFGEPDALPYERIHWSGATRQSRITALASLQSRVHSGIGPVIVTSARALMHKTLPAKELRLALRPIRVGEIVRLDQMATNWVQTGYAAAEIVEEPGTFARRGGIVDIWPPNQARPVRIDLFGDTVDSLRLFDPSSQRSEEHVDVIEIGPGSEALSKYGPAALERLGIESDKLDRLGQLSSDASPLQDPNLLLAVREELRREVENLHAGACFHGVEWYLPYFYEQPASLLDFAPAEAVIVIDDASDLLATMTELEAQAESLRTELIRSGELPAEFARGYFSADEVRERLIASSPTILGYGNLKGGITESNTPLARSFAPGPRFGGKLQQIVDVVTNETGEGNAVVLVTRQAARVQEHLRTAEHTVHVQSELIQPPAPGSTHLIQGIAIEGFVMRAVPTSGSANGTFDIHILTDSELFGWSKPRARRRAVKQSTVAPEVFFADVKPGDYVVHLEHGVGLYEGLAKLELNGVQREYLQVSYARSDKLYVPVHQAERLSRYVGAGEKSPIVNRLGTADWQTVKERARRAVADIADDLLQLYAERELARGHSFSPDGPWHEELASSFPFEETDDQLNAIEAVTSDMESPHPMDRLICGDVGYGKTEVAVRAAFKAITDGKQVAMLVPTTVLAQQHFRTMSSRLNRFPVKVEMLSRFRTPAQQAEIIKGVEAGTIDLVVGTHRLLSSDLVFKDLGLLIIDEEQRFGVVQKEKLKQLRTQLDVLTLSATPIPRTLHMSLSGVRDMSTINTPPKERLPVHTVLAEYDDVMVRQALERELARAGQVFIVHDRVRGIQALADRIQRLVPAAVVAVAHGQMPERQLEEVMVRFSEGDFDILVSTTIIENGLDIPNANTIIINRADHFGLAQLYQLRGRVGRSPQRGHCYLLYDKHSPLSYDARRRLSAILESSEELGSGFRIAMRDLEIRGAGELLGARQHGQIDSVGFDLYTRLLAQAINDAKRKKVRFEQAEQLPGVVDNTQPLTADGNGKAGATSTVPAPASHPLDLEVPFDVDDPLAPPVQLDLPVDAKIPEHYIPDESIRLQMYRRIAGISHISSLEEMRSEMVDRFGTDPTTNSVPEEIENLFYQIRVKILALRAGANMIGRELDQLVIRSDALENMNRETLQNRLDQSFALPKFDDVSAENRPRVARRAVYLPLDHDEQWRTALVRTLEIMAYS